MKRLFNLPKFRKPVFIPALLITGLILLNLVTPFKADAGVIGAGRIVDTVPFKSEKVSQTDSIVLNGNIKKVFPLFGAFDERKWAEGWNPTLVYMSADTIAVGTTFKTGSHGFGEPGYTWRINQYEPQKRLIQYLVMSPNRYWTITVKCRSVAPNKTLAAINYTFIGLNAMGNHLDEHFIEKIYKHHLKDWEQAINAFLEKDKQPVVRKSLNFKIKKTMKSHFLFPYWCRYLGWALVILHVPMSMLGRAHGMTNVMDSQPTNLGPFSGEHLFFISTSLLMTSGLFLVAFAKEKIEDEQIWHVRLDSLRWAIYINYIILIASLVFIEDIGHILALNLWVPLLFFIIRFRIVIFRLNRSLSKEA